MQRIVRKQTVLNVVDVSGSMLEPAGAGTRIDLAVKAIYDSMVQLPDDARAGLWVFSSDRGNDDPTGGLSEKSLITKLKAAQDDLVDGHQLILSVAGNPASYHAGNAGTFSYCPNPRAPLPPGSSGNA